MGRPCRPWGLVIAGAGVLIILALVLPRCVWWFLFGLALICAGLAVSRR